MLYEISNHELCVTVNDRGAELWAVRSADGAEYLWRGDSAYWEDRAPLMFPFCGRVQNDTYSYEGREYNMGCHGFAQAELFSARRISEEEIAFTLCSSRDTRKNYPFDFTLEVTYRLEGKRLSLSMRVENTGEGALPFMVGAHPGFFVPLDGGEFEDWFLEFGKECRPMQMEISPDGFRTGKREPYGLEGDRILRLRHSLFDIDGIFLEGAARSVTLRSEKSERSVSLSYPEMPYIGFWHCAGEAPYLCIEPWSGMPAVEGASEDLASKTDLMWLSPNAEKKTTIDITFA